MTCVKAVCTLRLGIPSSLAPVANLVLKCPLLKCFHQLEISAGRDPTAVPDSLSHRDPAQCSADCTILFLMYSHPSALFHPSTFIHGFPTTAPLPVQTWVKLRCLGFTRAFTVPSSGSLSFQRGWRAEPHRGLFFPYS